MRDFSTAYNLPNIPAVYALYSGVRRSSYVAYVGIGKNLKQRVIQHLIKRDSSVATGVSAVSLNPDHITSLSWWSHSSFEDTAHLKAAELVAFDILNPTLRSRGFIDNAVRELESNTSFVSDMRELFNGEPAGSIEFLSLSDAIEQIKILNDKINNLEEKINRLLR